MERHEYSLAPQAANEDSSEDVQVAKDPAEVNEIWLLNDMKALGLIAQGVALEHHTKIRPATSVIQAWNTMCDFYYRTTMHNRVTMTRRLHGGFKGKCINCGQVVHMKRDCPEMVNGDANKDSVFPVLVDGDTNEMSVVTDMVNGDANKGIANGNQDSVFAVGKDRLAGWLIDSGATAHMTPHRGDLFEYTEMSVEMHVTIADGKKIRVAGTGSVRLVGIDGNRIEMVEVLHIPGLDRRLLSGGN
ncbi:Polyprotein [Phytophthora palmivora]|uniref:Polyprotein n=1 Tax=Phytophthora palmivora TaxID=4796 RepID=A0A2P4YE33_9STRA|nr:Polyprotein [Phytophthora palmivora]